MSYHPNGRRGWPFLSCALNIHYLDTTFFFAHCGLQVHLQENASSHFRYPNVFGSLEVSTERFIIWVPQMSLSNIASGIFISNHTTIMTSDIWCMLFYFKQRVSWLLSLLNKIYFNCAIKILSWSWHFLHHLWHTLGKCWGI